MRVALAVLVVATVAGCRSESRRAPAPQPDPWAARDPWAVAPSPDDLPSLVERQRIANEACPRVTAPYFYRIEKAGKVSHILGTRHVGVPLSKFPQVVHDAIDSASLVVFEVAPGDDHEDEDEPIALREELGPKAWAHYRSLVGDALAQRLERGTPAAALLMMMVMYEDIGAMLDMEIQDKVVKAGVATGGLETAAFQDELLDRTLDLRMLQASIEHTENRKEIADDSRKDLSEYCAGTDDEPGMDDKQRKDLLASGYTQGELDRMDEEMVYERNADWIPKIEPMLDAGGAFIAVGADHLSGARGVIALLAARGYKATRLK